MNEYIKALATQAGFQTVDKFSEGEFAQHLEKFARLLIKECGHFTVDMMLFGSIEPEEGYDIMMRHFGVVE